MFVLVCSVRCQYLGYLGGTKTKACLKAKAMVNKTIGPNLGQVILVLVLVGLD